MGAEITIAQAILGAAAVSAGTAVISSQLNKGKGRGALLPNIGQEDSRAITKKDVSKKSARAALIAGGQAKGILTPAATSGRGTLFGN